MATIQRIALARIDSESFYEVPVEDVRFIIPDFTVHTGEVYVRDTLHLHPKKVALQKAQRNELGAFVLNANGEPIIQWVTQVIEPTMPNDFKSEGIEHQLERVDGYGASVFSRLLIRRYRYVEIASLEEMVKLIVALKDSGVVYYSEKERRWVDSDCPFIVMTSESCE